MVAPRLAFAVIVTFALLVSGCAIRPDHVTVFAERDVAETEGERRQSTVTNKTGVSATWDLSRR